MGIHRFIVLYLIVFVVVALLFFSPHSVDLICSFFGLGGFFIVITRLPFLFHLACMSVNLGR